MVGNPQTYDITAMGALLIDFMQDTGDDHGRALFERSPGGAPCRILSAAHSSGMKTALIGKVGNDIHGRYLRRELDREGIDVSNVTLTGAAYTTILFEIYDADGKRRKDYARRPGADTQLSFRDIDKNVLRNTKILHIDSQLLTEEPSRTTIFRAIKEAEESGAYISYEPRYEAELWGDQEIAVARIQSVLPYVDLLRLTEEEALLLTQCPSPEEAAKYLIDNGVRLVVITMSNRGVYAATKNAAAEVCWRYSDGKKTESAIDTFWGGFLAAFLDAGNTPEDMEKKDLEKNLQMGRKKAHL